MKGLAIRLAGVILMGLSVATQISLIDDVQIASAETARSRPTGSGSYDLYQGNVQIGTESYHWTTSPDGSTRIEGSCVVELDGVSTTLRPTLELEAASLTPRSFHYEQVQGDQIRRVDSQFDGGKVSQTIEENGMSSKRQLKIKPSELVVNEDVLYQFLLVAERYDFDRAGTQDFTLFDAKTGQNYVAHTMLRGLGTVQNSLGKFRARRLTLNMDAVAVDIYVDSQGRVPMIAIPLKGIEARMPGYKGDARVENNTAAPGPILGQQVTGS